MQALISQHFPADLHLKKADDFQKVMTKQEVKLVSRNFVLLATEHELGFSRLGLAIGKKNFKHAVVRNRIKRIIRESFRQSLIKEIGYDIVVIARRGADLQANQYLRRDIDKLWSRLPKG